MKNEIQTYAWGSRTAIADLCGLPSPSATPQAELWMGAHPRAPSQVSVDGRWMPLDRFIAADPAAVLGARVAQRFNSRLPYLLKILAVEKPLSVQAHPDARQAAEGFARENAAGIAMDAPNRNYKDPSGKPEIICAVTDFYGLNGFRPEKDIRDNLAAYCPRLCSLMPKASTAAAAGSDDDQRLRDLYRFVMTLPLGLQRQVTADCLNHLDGADPVLEDWIQRLSDAYPGDIGIISTLLLNFVHLKPGEAMYLPAGQLHAYLEGTGIELMANSDNVLRGGLTPKHIDVPELLRILRFAPTTVERLTCRRRNAQMCRYDTPAAMFQLSVIRTQGGDAYTAKPSGGPQILLAAAGEATVSWGGGQRQLILTKGSSALVPAVVKGYRVSGDAVIYVASVPTD
ncbi:MAG: mannose-6-phosphate isomerase, class I [Pseudomonadota bacterium]